MEITRTSQLTGKTRTLEIDITPDELNRWASGELIQNVVPHLSPNDREFIITGNTPEEWDEAFGGGDDEGPDPEERFWKNKATWDERHSDYDNDY